MFQEIHNKAAPFIKWLKEAEEESGSEEESDEEEGPEVSWSGILGIWKRPSFLSCLENSPLVYHPCNFELKLIPNWCICTLTLSFLQVEIEYSYQATSGLQESKVKPAAAEEDDDLDIDNI